jgi:O-antigen/teichoic acid export membrane protein
MSQRSRQESLGAAYLYSLSGTVVLSAMGIVSGVMCARLLGAEGRGRLALLMLVPSLTIRLGNLNLTQAVASMTSSERGAGRAGGPSAIVAAALLGMVEMAVLSPLLHVLVPQLAGPDLLVGTACMLTIPVTYLIHVLLGADLGRSDFLRYGLYQALPTVLYVAILVALVAAGRVSAASFALANLAAWLAVLILRAPQLLGVLGSGPICVRGLRSTLAWGSTFALPELAGLALLRFDYPLLARMVPPEALGYYAAALAIGGGQAALASPAGQVCFRLAGLHRVEGSGVRLLARQFRLFQPVFVAVGAAAFLAAPWITRLAFGAEFLPGVTTARWLIVAMTLWSCGQVLDNGMRSIGRSGGATLSNLCGLAVAVAVAAPLVGRWSIVGMGAAMCLGQAVSLGCKLVVLRAGGAMGLGGFLGFSLREMRGAVAETRLVVRRPA